MLYHYSAVDVSGQSVEADYEANSLDQVLLFLQGKGLRPLQVQPLKPKKGLFSKAFGGKISSSDKVFLTKYLALMLKVGIDLLSAINILIADFQKSSVRNFLLDVRANVSQGQPFWKSFEAHPETFSPTFVSLVRAAELSGNLQRTFEDLSVSTERDAELQSRVRWAMIYPIILLCMAVAIMTFLVTFALPKIANVFEQSNLNPPAFSQFVFTVGLFLGANIAWILPLGLGIVAGLIFFVRKTKMGKRWFDNVLMGTPVVRKVYEEIALQRMANTISSLLQAGLPILETIHIAADTVGHRRFAQALDRIADDGLAKGLTIGEAFRRENVFPQTVTNLIAISEQAGHLQDVLGSLATFYENEIDQSLKTLMALLEPLLLLVMGTMVAFVALAIIVPVYQLTSSF